MPIATLVNDRETERDFQIVGGKKITIGYEEDSYEYRFYFKENGKIITENAEFIFIDKDEIGDKYLLARMYSPYKQKGLGTALVQFFIDITGAEVYTRQPGELDHGDGSHLTENAPEFVPELQKKGMIKPWH
jgi:hypothetical protein